ncbi:MAG: tetratricopeptide repeat protein [Nitrospinales bacterium]
MGLAFYFFFLVLTPLGLFNDWIPPLTQKGYYSVTTIDPGDDTGYYAYLRSGFFDGDWDFINEHHYAHSEKFTSTGYVSNYWQIGQSVLFLPFFLLGHLAALIYNKLGYAVSVDGYSAPYYMATAIASQTYLFAGLLLLFSILKKRFGDFTALISTLAVWLGSPLIYYTFIRQRMAHTAEFFVVVVFFYFWLEHRKSNNLYLHAWLGSILGFLCMIRIVNVIFFALYMTDKLLLIRSGNRNSSVEMMKVAAPYFTAFSLSFMLVLSPQFLAWHRLYGVPIDTSNFSFVVDETSRMSFLSIPGKLYAVMLKARWGVLWSAPLLVIGFAGLLTAKDFLKEIRVPLMVFLVSLVSLIVLIHDSIGTYGYRYLVVCLPILALGLGAILEKCFRSRLGMFLSVLFVALCVTAQYFMIIQYKVTLLHNDPEFTLKALDAILSLIMNQPHLLLRSTNFMRLIFLDHPQGWDYNDFLFLFVFPLAQFICVGLLCFSFYWLKKDNGREIKNHFKFLLGLGVLFGFSLNIIVQAVTPSKTAQEVDARRQYIQAMKEADLAFEKGQNNRAINLYLKAQNLIPELPASNFKIGLSLDKEKKPNEANKYYKKVLNEYPGNAAARYNLGINLVSLGQFQEAEKNLEIAVRLAPGNKKIYNALAKIYAKKNDLNTATKFFQAALTIDPEYGKAHANLALLFTILKNPVEAKEHLNAAIRLGVTDPLVAQLSKFHQIHN